VERTLLMGIEEPTDKEFVGRVRAEIDDAKIRCYEVLGKKPPSPPPPPPPPPPESAAHGSSRARLRRHSRASIIEDIQRHAHRTGYPPTAEEWRTGGDDHPTYSTVVSYFFSWPDAIEAAGYPRPRRGRHGPSRNKGGSPEVRRRRQDVLFALMCGRSQHELAEDFGVSHETIRQDVHKLRQQHGARSLAHLTALAALDMNLRTLETKKLLELNEEFRDRLAALG
jgi:hypothetical protein